MSSPEAPAPSARPSRVDGWRGMILAALIALVAGLPGVFALPPLDRDESRFAQATAQMLETGDYVNINFQDAPRHKKPVGIHWLQAASVALTSEAGLNDGLAFPFTNLAIAMAALQADGQLAAPPGLVYLAEVSLDGALRPVRGVLPAVLAAVRAGYDRIVVATANAEEAALVTGAQVRAYDCLADAAAEFGADPRPLRRPASQSATATDPSAWMPAIHSTGTRLAALPPSTVRPRYPMSAFTATASSRSFGER